MRVCPTVAISHPERKEPGHSGDRSFGVGDRGGRARASMPAAGGASSVRRAAGPGHLTLEHTNTPPARASKHVGRRGAEQRNPAMPEPDTFNQLDDFELSDPTRIRISEPIAEDGDHGVHTVDLTFGPTDPVRLQVIAWDPADVADALRELARKVDSAIAQKAEGVGQ